LTGENSDEDDVDGKSRTKAEEKGEERKEQRTNLHGGVVEPDIQRKRSPCTNRGEAYELKCKKKTGLRKTREGGLSTRRSRSLEKGIKDRGIYLFADANAEARLEEGRKFFAGNKRLRSKAGERRGGVYQEENVFSLSRRGGEAKIEKDRLLSTSYPSKHQKTKDNSLS